MAPGALLVMNFSLAANVWAGPPQRGGVATKNVERRERGGRRRERRENIKLGTDKMTKDEATNDESMTKVQGPMIKR